VYTEAKSKLWPTQKKSPEAIFSASSIWPTGNTVNDEFLRKELVRISGSKDSTKEIEKILMENKKQFFNDYANQNKGAVPKDTVDREFMNWEAHGDIEIMYSSAKILSISESGFAYEGGAWKLRSIVLLL
jgi:hypothetical protein